MIRPLLHRLLTCALVAAEEFAACWKLMREAYETPVRERFVAPEELRQQTNPSPAGKPGNLYERRYSDVMYEDPLFVQPKPQFVAFVRGGRC